MALARFEREQRLPLNHDDQEYVAHGLLTALFGPELTPTPFLLEDRDARTLDVLAYSGVDGAMLHCQAQQFADPAHYRLVEWDSLASKPMPSQWRVGMRAGFVLRVCPVKRIAKRGPGGDTDRPEVDAFLHAAWHAGDAVLSREEVYSRWVQEALERSEAVSVESVRVESFRRVRLVRRTYRSTSEPRRAHVLERPEARVTGEIVVRDGAKFSALLRRGVGRHRDFGFGMLLVTPPRG
jgi:CRISPR system Cascade subunit CasE